MKEMYVCTQIFTRKFTEVQKQNRYACSRSFFSPGWKNDSDYMDFSSRLAGLKILAPFENTGLGFLALAGMRPGLNPLHVIDNLILRAGMKFAM